MDNCDRLLIHLFLVKALILDEVDVDEIAQVRTGVPPHVVGVHIDFTQHSDHLSLVGSVGFGTRGRCCAVEVLLFILRLGRQIDDREREAICDFEAAFDIHTNKTSSRSGWKTACAVLEDLHDDLFIVRSRDLEKIGFSVDSPATRAGPPSAVFPF